MTTKNNSVFMRTMRFVTLKHPLLFIGVPGFVILILGIIMVVRTFSIASQTGIWSLEITFLSVAVLFSGVILLSASLILYSLSYLMIKIEKRLLS